MSSFDTIGDVIVWHGLKSRGASHLPLSTKSITLVIFTDLRCRNPEVTTLRQNTAHVILSGLALDYCALCAPCFPLLAPITQANFLIRRERCKLHFISTIKYTIQQVISTVFSHPIPLKKFIIVRMSS